MDNIIKKWSKSNQPIFYINIKEKYYCCPLWEAIILKAKANKCCYIGVVDFKKEIKEQLNSYEAVTNIIVDQLEKYTSDKTFDVQVYNFDWKPCEVDFERYRNFYTWKISDKPIYYADNDGNCWASDDIDWMKDKCIRDIKDNVAFVEIHVQNYDKQVKLKFQDYDDVCDELGDTPIVDDIIFSAKFSKGCDEDMPQMSRKIAISKIRILTHE